jgi:hypothetical protein
MLTKTDLIRLPYTPDLTEGGIAYACRSLPHTYDRMGGSPFDRLRRIVAGVAAELALRRHLGSLEVPFDVQGATPFTDPDRYDVSLGGRRCDLKSYLITRREQIEALRGNPAPLLEAPALVPLDQFNAGGGRDQDLYLFAFLLGLVAASPRDLDRALQAGQPVHLIHPLPSPWARPRLWRPLGELALKSESGEPLVVELGGQNEGRGFLSERLELPPRTRRAAAAEFHSLAYVHVSARPGGRLGLHAPALGETCLIARHEWGNIWVYGLQVLLAGYLTREEFRRRAAVLPAGSRVYQYQRTRTRNLAVPLTELRPLDDLFARAKQWAEAGKSSPEKA